MSINSLEESMQFHNSLFPPRIASRDAWESMLRQKKARMAELEACEESFGPGWIKVASDTTFVPGDICVGLSSERDYWNFLLVNEVNGSGGFSGTPFKDGIMNGLKCAWWGRSEIIAYYPSPYRRIEMLRRSFFGDNYSKAVDASRKLTEGFEREDREKHLGDGI